MKQVLRTKSLLALVLALAMLLSLVPAGSLAAECTCGKTDGTHAADCPDYVAPVEPVEDKKAETAPVKTTETTPVKATETTPVKATETTPAKATETTPVKTTETTPSVKEASTAEPEQEEPAAAEEPAAVEEPETEPSSQKSGSSSAPSITPVDDDEEQEADVTLVKTTVVAATDKKETTQTPEGTGETEAAEEAKEPEEPEEEAFVVEYGAISGSISWSGDAEGAERPAFEIKLLQDGTKVDAITAPKTDTTYSFDDKPFTDEQGNAYSYKISVPKHRGNYSIAQSGTTITVTYKAPVVEQKDETPAETPVVQEQVTDALIEGQDAETVTVGGTIAWPTLPEGASPTLTISLAGHDSKVLSAGDPSYSFGELPAKNDDGDIDYTVSASVYDALEGYEATASVSNFDIAVAYVKKVVVDKLSVGGTLSWGENAPEGAGLTVTLSRNGVALDGKALSLTPNDGDYSFDELAKTDDEGNEVYEYAVSGAVAEVAGYAASVEQTGNDFAVSYKADTSIKLTGNITWTNNTPVAVWPELVLTLGTAGGDGAAHTATFGPADAAYAFEDLPGVDDAGNAYPAYTVTATLNELSGYNATAAVAETGDVEVTLALADDIAALFGQIEAAIAAMPSFEAVGDMDPTRGAYEKAIADYAAITALFEQLPSTDLWALVNNYGTYCTLGTYLAPGNIVIRGISGVKNSASIRFAPVAPRRTRIAGSRAVVENGAVETMGVDATIDWDVTAAPTTAIASSVTLTLSQTGPTGTVANYGTLTLNKTTFGDAKKWTGHFANQVPKTTVSGKPYTYTVTCTAAGGTAKLILASFDNSSYNVSVRYADAVPTSIKATIEWKDEPVDSSKVRPAKVKVDLLNATSTGATTHDFVNSENWSYTFTGITGKTTAAEEIRLSVTAVTGYTPAISVQSDGSYLIRMFYTNSPITIEGTITWPGTAADQKIRPNSVTVTAYAQGSYVASTSITVDTKWGSGDANANKFVFANLPSVDQYGRTIYYGVVQSSANGYTTYADGYNITNYVDDYSQIHLQVAVNWKDDGNRRARRPIETTLYLYRDGHNTGMERQVRLANQWRTVFSHLDRTDGNGHYYEYSVRAAKVPYYYARPAYARFSSYATLTYIYGTGSYDGSTTTTTTTKISPKVGDPLAYNAFALTAAQKAQLVLEDQRAATLNKELAAVAHAANAAGDSVNFTDLRKSNNDVAGWLVSSGTQIDYPIVRGVNNSYYLNHLFDKTSGRSGTLFMDSACNKSLKSRNTVVYGHHMADGTMFASLLDYKKQTYYDAHPVMQLYTPNGNYDIELFAAFATGDEYETVARTSFKSDSEFMTYVSGCIKKSDFNTSVNVSASDNIVTFVTCSYDYDDTRYLVMGKLTKN